jgi:hypothetical protein
VAIRYGFFLRKWGGGGALNLLPNKSITWSIIDPLLSCNDFKVDTVNSTTFCFEIKHKWHSSGKVYYDVIFVWAIKTHLSFQLHVYSLLHPSNASIYHNLFVCVGVMYSGEYDVCGVTPGKLKSLPDHRSRVRFPPWSGKLFSLPGADARSE